MHTRLQLTMQPGVQCPVCKIWGYPLSDTKLPDRNVLRSRSFPHSTTCRLNRRRRQRGRRRR